MTLPSTMPDTAREQLRAFSQYLTRFAPSECGGFHAQYAVPYKLCTDLNPAFLGPGFEVSVDVEQDERNDGTNIIWHEPRYVNVTIIYRQ